MSLTEQAGKGFFWVAVERFGQQLLQGISLIILARLLTPDDFGLVGMLMIFLAVSQSFIDSGMGQALIREKTITDSDRATVFWLNLFMSIVFYGLLFFTAPLIAAFYRQPELISLTRVMGLAIIFNGVAIVQRAELTQKLEFKKQAYAQVPSLFIAGVVSIVMAYYNYGVWALVAQFILTSFFSSLFLWMLAPSRILIKWDAESFHRLFHFGYKLLLSGLLDTTYQHIYKLVIGKFFMAATLGFYTQAQRVQQLASQNLVGIIQKVTYPLLSKAGEDPVRLKRGYRQVIQSSSFLVFPGMLLMILFARPIMLYILGPQWLPAAPFLQILCLSGILYHLHAINLNILQVLGRSDLFLKLEIYKKLVITAAIIVGLQYGIFGLLIGQVIASYLALWINTYYTAKFLNYSIFEQVQDVLIVFLFSLPMMAVAYLITLAIPVESIWHLLLYLLISGGIYIFTILIKRTQVTDIALSFLPDRLKTLLNI